jgi:hypothetical protein
VGTPEPLLRRILRSCSQWNKVGASCGDEPPEPINNRNATPRVSSPRICRLDDIGQYRSCLSYGIEGKRMSMTCAHSVLPLFAMSVATQIIEATTTCMIGAEREDSHQDTNEAFVLSPTKQFTFEKRPIPEFRSSKDVRVRIVATGLCGSDVCSLVLLDPSHTNQTLHVDSLLATRTYWSICR